MPDISLVIPAKDEEQSIQQLVQWISRVMDAHGFSYEVLFVDDGSLDNTWTKIVAAANDNASIKGLRFNRNFGKSAALHTAFKEAAGRVVITMDADLQDSPDEIPELYRMVTQEGFHLVSGWKKKRHDPITKTLPSKLFNRVVRMMSGIKLHDFNCGLKAYANPVVKNITVYGDMHRFIPLLAKWAGFNKIGEKVVEHHERKYGKSKFGIARLLSGFLDLLTITFVGRFARRPMHFFGSFGVLAFLSGFAFTVKILLQKLYSVWITGIPLKRDVTDQPLFYLALVALILGVQLFLTGFIAELIARQVVSRKDYLVIERTGVKS
jgi:glycosyltransferase involved in cell wall biosynthesis